MQIILSYSSGSCRCKSGQLPGIKTVQWKMIKKARWRVTIGIFPIIMLGSVIIGV